MINKETVERNNYIDYLRGIAALGIIAIHTAFWGGQSYIPKWFQNLTLFLDVPFFFYLSGWAKSYGKSDIAKTGMSLLRIWFKWIFFVTILAVFCALSKFFPYSFQGVTDFRELVNNFMFNVSIPGFPVVTASMWFMPYYFVVMIINAIIIELIEQRNNKSTELKMAYMWILLAAFVWAYYENYLFGLELRYFLFYSFFWMLGYNRLGKCKKTTNLFLCILACVGGFIFASYLQGLELYDIQNSKFPPSIKYGAASMVAILIAKYFNDKRRNFGIIISHIGRNAIWYYFGQGIGSSLNYYVVEAVKIDNWFLKFIVTYVINAMVTIGIAESLSLGYRNFAGLCTKIKKVLSKWSHYGKIT